MKIFEPKLFSTLRGYTARDVLGDVVAGIIVAIIALPLSIALAIASGAEPATGLYTAIIAGFLTSMLGGSKVNISGPTAAFATIVAGIILGHGMDGLVLATIMAGIILVIMGVCRLGSLIKYIPHTITVGFTSGIAVTLFVGQMKDFLGLKYPAGAHAIETIEKLKLVFENISTINVWSIAVGVLALVILIVLPKIFKKVPPSLIAVVVGALIVALAPIGVDTVGSLYIVQSGLPSVTIPSISLDRILTLLPSAITIALLASIESLLSCVVSDKMIDDTHNPNTELIALGIGNSVTAIFGGIPATGAIARTAANVKNGAKSPLSGMTHAIVLLLVLVVLMPYASMIPMPVIASILFVVAYNMSEYKQFFGIIKSKKLEDIVVLVVTFVLTVVFDLVVAIAVGMAIHYLILLIKKLSRKQ